jgi:exonuclease SbcC
MQLRSLTVRNVRSYLSGRIELGPGTTLLSGDVGSGKTSLLYAIEMALFGFAEVEAAFLVRHRTRDAEVTLGLADAEHHYEFRRRFRRKTQRGREGFEIEESSFSVDGARTRYSATELRQRAIDLLGFPDNPNPRAHSDVWRWAVYIPQERMRDVLFQSPTERLETVRKALGLEQYQIAADNAAEVAAELRRLAEVGDAEAEQLRHWSEELPRWSETRLARAREVEVLGEEEGEQRTACSAAEAALADAEAAARAAVEDQRLLERLAADLERSAREGTERVAEAEKLESEARQRREEAARIAAELARVRMGPTLDEARARVQALEAELATSEASAREQAQVGAGLEAARRARTEAEHRRDQLRAELGRLTHTLHEAEAERPLKEPPAPTDRTLAELGAELERLQGEIDAARDRFAQERHLAEDLHELLREGSCPRCHQPVRPEDFRTHFEAAEARRLGAARDLEQLTAQRRGVEEGRAARERYERSRERFEQVEMRRRQLRELVAGSTGRLEQAEREVEARSQEIARLERREAELAPAVAQRAARVADRATQLGALQHAEEEERARSRQAEVERGLLARAELLVEQAIHWRDQAEVSAARRAGLARELASAELRVRDRPDPRPALATARSAHDHARSELERVVGRRATAQAGLEEASRRIVEAEAGDRIRSARISEANHARRLAGWVGREFREGLLDLEHRRLAQAQSEFNRAFARYFSTLVEDPELLARCDVAFSPSVEIDGEVTPAEALSGGERTALALAYRLAMGRVVRGAGRLKLETLILDEPTDGFSPEQVSRMGELLEELQLPQVLIVSHESGLSGIADHLVRVHKEEGASVIEADGVPRPEETAPEGEAPDPRPRRAPRRRPPAGDLTPEAAGTPGDPMGGTPRPEGSPPGARDASARPAS